MSSTQRRTVRSTSARGWCPRHDHVYPFRDGLCPECGTSLVPVERPVAAEPEIEVVREAPRPPSSTPARSPQVARLFIGAVILGAFVLGLVFPRQSPAPSEPTTPVVLVTQDVSVGDVARVGAGGLQLVRLQQKGEAFTVAFAAEEGFPDPATIAGVALEMRTQDAEDLFDNFSVPDQRLVRSPGGFSVEGRIPAGHGRIVAVRISSIQVRDGRTPSWSVDLAGIWPVRRAEPKVLHVGSAREAGGGATVRLVALLAWRDRIEADFQIRSGPLNNIAIDGIEMAMSGEGDGIQDSWRTTLVAAQQEQVSPGEILARFEGVPSGVGRVTIRASRLSRFLSGTWSWRIG